LARILIVEDDPDMARLMRAMLVADGHELQVLGDGLAALETLATQPVELLLLDVEVPGKNGIELCRAVRDAESSDRRTTIVMLTGRHDTASKLLAFDAGADDYLVKPIDARELRTRVARWLDSRKLHADMVVRRRREAIQEIVAAICHEVNNPLAVAMMGVDLVLTRGTVDGESAHELRLAREHLERIGGVLLSLQRIEDRTVPYIGEHRMIDIRGGAEK
jgi:DNA-binding response OmpR family regulator